MDLTLIRKQRRADGIFSVLKDPLESVIAWCCEHAYPTAFKTFAPKIPNGIYECVRGLHQLSGMTHPFETFEIMDVPEHTKILFHVGNFQTDSWGCVLLGKDVEMLHGLQMVTESRSTFSKFMDLQKGVDKFILIVQG